MQLIRQLMLTLMMWVLLFISIALIVLIPREVTAIMEGHHLQISYSFSWDAYRQNIHSYVNNVIDSRGLGHTSRFSVIDEIKIGFGRTLKVLLPAFGLAVVFGVLKGVYDYKSLGKKRSMLGNGITSLMQALPDFFVIIIIQIIVLWLFLRGIPTPPVFFGADKPLGFVLPAFLVSLFPLFYIARITSAALVSQDRELYIQTARAKGLREWLVLYKHVLGNCWGLILSQLSSMLAFMLSNLLMVEHLLAYHGAASRLFYAIRAGGQNEFTIRYGTYQYQSELIIGFFLVFILLTAVVHMISQAAKHAIDPRWRQSDEI